MLADITACLSFVFLVGLVRVGLMRAFEIEEKDRPKETVAGFVLLSLIFGALIALARIGFNYIHFPPPAGLGLGFNNSAIVLSACTGVLMLVTGMVIRGRYEPIAGKRKSR